MPRRRTFTGRLFLAGLVIALLLFALVGLLARALSAVAPRRRAGGALVAKRQGETIASTLAVVACLAAALGTAAATSATTAAADGREPTQSARLDEGATASGTHWGWLRGWSKSG